MKSYGNTGHGGTLVDRHVPLPKTGINRPGSDILSRLEAKKARVSPIRQATGIDPDAVARLIRNGILTEAPTDQQEEGGPTVLVRKRKPRAPRFNTDHIVDAYQGGATLTEVADKFGCSRETARAHLRRAGIELRDDRATIAARRWPDPKTGPRRAPKEPRQAKPRTPKPTGERRKPGPQPTFDVTKAIELAQAGTPVTRIAADLGVSQRTIRNHLAAAGIRIVDGRTVVRSDHIDDAIVTDYTSGLTVQQTATKHGIALATIRRRLKAAGVNMRDDRATNSGGQNHLPADVEVRIVELYQQGLTGKEVARQLGIGQTSVGRVLRRHNITARAAADTQRGRPGQDNARGLKDLMAANGITAAEVRAWARATGRPIPDRGLPGRHLVEDYLLTRRIPA